MKKIITMLFAITPLFAEPSVKLDLPPALQKEIIPNFAAKDKEVEEDFRISDLKKAIEPTAERVALVYFSTPCKPCMEGMIQLRDNKDLLKKNKIQIVLINVGEAKSCLGTKSAQCGKDLKVVREWVKKFSNPEWLLIMDVNQQLVWPFGLTKSKMDEVQLPRTLLLNNKLKPLLLLGTEGDNWPKVLWEEIEPETIKGEPQ